MTTPRASSVPLRPFLGPSVGCAQDGSTTAPDGLNQEAAHTPHEAPRGPREASSFSLCRYPFSFLSPLGLVVAADTGGKRFWIRGILCELEAMAHAFGDAQQSEPLDPAFKTRQPEDLFSPKSIFDPCYDAVCKATEDALKKLPRKRRRLAQCNVWLPKLRDVNQKRCDGPMISSPVSSSSATSSSSPMSSTTDSPPSTGSSPADSFLPSASYLVAFGNPSRHRA